MTQSSRPPSIPASVRPSRHPLFACLLACSLALAAPAANAAADPGQEGPAAGLPAIPGPGSGASFPWSCQAGALPGEGPAAIPHRALQGEWISSFDPSRVLDIRDETFSLQGTGRNLAGRVSDSGATLLFESGDGQQCRVIWQLLGDGRLSLNSGQDLLHRRGEPAIPATTVRQYGNAECRFTVAVPSVLPVQETDDGVRIYSVERDAAMQILSGTTDQSPRDFAKGIADRLGSTDFQAVQGEANAYTFSAEVQGIPMLQYVVMDRKQFLHVSLMGQYNKLVSYLKYVKIVPREEERPLIP